MKPYDLSILLGNVWLGFALVCLSLNSEKQFVVALTMSFVWGGLSAFHLWRDVRET